VWEQMASPALCSKVRAEPLINTGALARCSEVLRGVSRFNGFPPLFHTHSKIPDPISSQITLYVIYGKLGSPLIRDISCCVTTVGGVGTVAVQVAADVSRR